MRRDTTYQQPYKPNRYAFTFDALYDLRVVQGLSFQRIAQRFGDCDHTTVIHACRRLGVPLERPLIEPDR
jgi:hypothetical protein